MSAVRTAVTKGPAATAKKQKKKHLNSNVFTHGLQPISRGEEEQVSQEETGGQNKTWRYILNKIYL